MAGHIGARLLLVYDAPGNNGGESISMSAMDLCCDAVKTASSAKLSSFQLDSVNSAAFVQRVWYGRRDSDSCNWHDMIRPTLSQRQMQLPSQARPLRFALRHSFFSERPAPLDKAFTHVHGRFQAPWMYLAWCRRWRDVSHSTLAVTTQCTQAACSDCLDASHPELDIFYYDMDASHYEMILTAIDTRFT